MNTGGDPHGGFTIVETLIVLAVTGFLFVSIAGLISGRQGKTEFQTAINGLQQQIQQIINETESGYYPNGVDYSCTAGLGLPPTISTGTPGKGQGANSSCIFLGKVLQFGPSDAAYKNPEKYLVWPIAGNQNLAGAGSDGLLGAGDQTLAKSYPTPIVPIRSSSALQSGLTVDHMTYDNGAPGVPTAGVGFMVGNGDANGTFAGSTSDGLGAGSLPLSLYAIKSTQVGTSSANDMQAALSSASGSPLRYTPVDSVDICVNSGTTHQSGLITIGSSSSADGVKRQLTVTLKIYGAPQCA
ncbi:MAG TPA: hypothetical protein VFH39_03100 [Candidatus Saccharimonadales bacterium]|nr:hypothetical protein [Candidatus Saccharimonadales bacterium]